MSFREKIAWTSLVVHAGVWGYYAWRLAEAIRAGATAQFNYLGLMIVLIVVLVVVHVAVVAAIAVANPKEASLAGDERERLIELKATSAAFYFMTSVAVLAAGAIAWWQVPAFYAANGLFLGAVLSEIVKGAGQVILYRRGV